MQPNPYAAPVTASAAPLVKPVPAGFWWRVLAELIDYLIFLPLGFLVLANAYLWHSAVIAQLQTPLWVAYRIVLDASGGTIGKRAIRLRLVDAAGAAPGARRALLRNVHHLAFLLIALSLRWFGYRPEHAAAIGPHGELDPAMWLAAAVGWVYGVFCLVTAIFVAARDDKRGLHDLWSGVWCLRLPPSDAEPAQPAPAAA